LDHIPLINRFWGSRAILLGKKRTPGFRPQRGESFHLDELPGLIEQMKTEQNGVTIVLLVTSQGLVAEALTGIGR
jgi:hypothetical protein